MTKEERQLQKRLEYLRQHGFSITFQDVSGYCLLSRIQRQVELQLIPSHMAGLGSFTWRTEDAINFAESVIDKENKDLMTEEVIERYYSVSNHNLEDVSLDTRYHRAFELVNGDPDAMLRYGHPGDWDHIIVDQILIDACPYNSI